VHRARHRRGNTAQLKARQRTAVGDGLAFALHHMQRHRGLAILEGGEFLGTGNWQRRVARDDFLDQAAHGLDAQGQRTDIEQQPFVAPKPLDNNAFSTLVKTASEFVRRSEQQLHAALHQSVDVSMASSRITVCLDIVPDDDKPSATLSARDEAGELLAEVRVTPSFQLKRGSAVAWVESGFARPAER